jgi:hypothetical protein
MKDYSGDKTVSVESLLEKFTCEITEKEKLEKEEEDKIVKEYSNSYFKCLEDEGMFGKNLEVLKIDSIKTSSFTDRWERTYQLKGTEIKFSKINVFLREFSTDDVYSLYTAKKLKNFTKITEEEYNFYFEKYNSLNEEILKLLE